MKKTFKSFTKFYFQNWGNLLGVVLFTIAAFSMLIGLLSSPLKVRQIVNNVSANYQRWDYGQRGKWQNYNADILYDYFFNLEDSQFPNSFHESLLNFDAKVYYSDQSTQTFADYLTTEYEASEKKEFFTKFVIRLLASHILNYSTFTSEGLIKLPTHFSANPGPWVIEQEIFGSQWLSWLKNNLFWPAQIISEDLIQQFNLTANHPLTYEANYSLNFEIDNSLSATPISVEIDGLNVNRSDNVVSSEVSASRISEMTDDEVLINSSFAYKHHLKVGDSLKIAHFFNRDGSDSEISGTYKIIGFGAKLTNLTAPLKSLISPTQNETLLLYLNNNEINHYLNYIVQNQNTAFTDIGISKSDFFESWILQRLRLMGASKSTINDYQQFIQAHGLEWRILLTEWSDDNYLPYLNFLNIQIYIVITIGLIILIFVVIFINFFIKNKIQALRHEIGVFKAFGYFSWQLSLIFGVLTLITFLGCAVVGYALSLPLQIFTNNFFTQNLLIRVPAINTNIVFLCVLIIVMPLVLALISYLNAFFKINRTTLGLIYYDQNKRVKKNSQVGKKPHPQWGNTLNLIRFHKNFILSAIPSHLVVLVIFFFTTLLLTFQFAVPNIFQQSTEQLMFYTAPATDHKDGLTLGLKWFKNGEKLDFANSQNFDLDVQEYRDNAEIVAETNNPFAQKVIEYLAINRHSETAQAEIKTKLMEIALSDVNHQTIKIETIYQFLMMFESDYAWFLHDNPAPIPNSVIETVHEAISKSGGWLAQFTILHQHFANNQKSTCLTFNKVYVKKKMDGLVLDIDFDASAKNNFYRDKFFLKLTDANSRSFFKWRGITSDQWSALVDDNNYLNGQIPIIIGNKFAKNSHVQINDVFEMAIYGTQDFFKFKVVGINQADNVMPNLYTDFAKFKEHYFVDQIQQLNLYNEFYSRQVLFKSDELNLANAEKMTFYNDYINILYFGPQQNFQSTNPIYLTDLFSHSDSLLKFVSVPFDTAFFEPFVATRMAIDHQVEEINVIFTVIEYCEFAMVFIIIVYIMTYLNEKRKKEMALLKTMGYKNSEIIFLIFSSYFGIMWVSFIFSCLLLFLLLRVLQSIVRTLSLSDIVYQFPWTTILIPLAFIVILTLTIFTICIISLRKQKFEILE